MNKKNVFGIKFIIPLLNQIPKKMGVYKVTFDTGFYYIGSSNSLRTRINYWKHKICYNKKNNEIISDILPDCKVASFDIIKLIEDASLLKTEEYEYIKQQGDDPFLLNIYKSRRPKNNNRATNTYIHRNKIKVIQFDLNGSIIHTYDSIKDTSIVLNISTSLLWRIFSGKNKYWKGFVFKRIDKKGNVLENKPFISKTRKGFNSPLARPVLKMDIEGNVIDKYKSIAQAAAWSTTGKKRISEVVTGKKRTYKGFTYKYAS